MAAAPTEAMIRQFEALYGENAGALEVYRARRPGATDMDCMADLATEVLYAKPTRQLAATAEQNGARVHAYRFDWSPDGSPFKACHCVELPFVFGTLPIWDAPMLSEGDLRQMHDLVRAMVDAWASFVVSGDPSIGRELPWPRYRPVDGSLATFFGQPWLNSSGIDPRLISDDACRQG